MTCYPWSDILTSEESGVDNMFPDYSLIGKRIKKYRIKSNLTQVELAEKLNVSITFLSRIECGSTHINLRRLAQISNILGISPSEILTGCNTESKDYLKLEFSQILDKCSPKQQKLIYELSELVSKTEM